MEGESSRALDSHVDEPEWLYWIEAQRLGVEALLTVWHLGWGDSKKWELQQLELLGPPCVSVCSPQHGSFRVGSYYVLAQGSQSTSPRGRRIQDRSCITSYNTALEVPSFLSLKQAQKPTEV